MAEIWSAVESSSSLLSYLHITKHAGQRCRKLLIGDDVVHRAMLVWVLGDMVVMTR